MDRRFYFAMVGVMPMYKLYEALTDREREKLKGIKKKTKRKKEEKINWHEIMGTNRPRYKRVRGAIRRK
jgi:hypothetical protein